MKSLRDAWRDGETTLGLWAGLGHGASAEALAQTGAAYVCADLQHGIVGYADAPAMFQSILLGGSSPIARVPWYEPGIIGKLLDAGSHGIIVPMVNSRAEAEAAVAACRYPPAGARSWGPIAAMPRNSSYFTDAADQVAAIVMVETAEALRNVDEIVAVPGVDAVYVGPADLSISLGLGPGNHDDEPVFVEALETIVASCQNAGVVPGIHSSGSLTPRRLEMGFRMVTVSSDLVAMRMGLKSEFAKARGEGADGDSNAIY